MRVAKTIQKKNPCYRCGTNEFYASSKMCVKCKRLPEHKDGSIRKLALDAARKGKTTFRYTEPCAKCGTFVRYAGVTRGSGSCVHCKKSVKARRDTDFLPGTTDWISSRYLRMQLA